MPPVFIQEYRRVLERMFPPSQQYDRISGLATDFHVSGKNGPNGPMLGTAFVDREAIKQDDIEKSVLRLCQSTGNYQLLGLLSQSRAGCDVVHKRGKDMVHSKISIKYESGGKTRPFAICDFFTQSALKGIHQFLMNYLKGLEQDGSDSHADAAEAVRKWTETSLPIYSFDLTSATDRWPVELIHIAMEACFDKEIADSWKKVITDRTFTGPSGEKVRWEVGQPLGALSSWAAFAVSHHAFIQTCERMDWLELNSFGSSPKVKFRPPSSYYRMIGDDIVITRYPRVAEKYRYYLGQFGIGISYTKSVLPQHCLKGNAAEIAKRLFVNGEEITPVPPEAILQGSKPFGLRNLLESSLSRGYTGAASPYPVQSSPLSPEDWRLITFPFRNALPQLNGVKSLFPSWEATGDAPAGLSPRWFTWLDIPSEHLQSLVKEFILNEIIKSETETRQLINRLSFTTGRTNPLEGSLPQGGDWMPGPARCHPQIVLTVLRWISQKLMELSFSWIDPRLLDEDLYRMIGQFHLFLEPKLLVFGRKSLDQKELTRVYLSRIVKHCWRNRLNNADEENSDFSV